MSGLLASPWTRGAGAILAAAGLAAILRLTLFASPEQAPFAALTPLLCLVCGEHGASDVALNLLLFTPFGAGLRLFGWSWRRVLLASGLLSLSVETLQYFVVTGRDASLSDLITNTAGGGIGAAIAGRIDALVLPDPALARRLFVGAAATWLAVFAASAAALLPWAPPGPIRNECTGSAGKADNFSQTVRSVAVNGIPLGCDAELSDPRPIREAMARGEVEVQVEALSAPPVRGRLLIQALRGDDEFLLLVAQDRRSAVFNPPTQSLRFRLHAPILRLRDGFPVDEGVPVRLHAGMRGRRLWIASEYAGQPRRTEVELTPSHGWSTILAWGIRRVADLRIATAIWIGALTLPLGYWAGRTGRPAVHFGGVAAVLLLGLGLLPAVTGYAPVHWSEWLGGGLGAALGWALYRLGTYLQTRCGSPSIGAFSSP